MPLVAQVPADDELTAGIEAIIALIAQHSYTPAITWNNVEFVLVCSVRKVNAMSHMILITPCMCHLQSYPSGGS